MNTPEMIKTDEQMVGLTVVMSLGTFKKLKILANGEDMRAWSNKIVQMIERAS